MEGVGAGEFIDQAGQTEAAHAVIGATRGMGERGCNKGFPDTGRPCDQNIQVSADPAEIAHGGQQRRIEVSRETVVQILQTRRLRQCRHPQALRKAVVVALGQLVLVFVVALYAAGFYWLRKLANFERPERLFAASDPPAGGAS